jgi:hypothetical protein
VPNALLEDAVAAAKLPTAVEELPCAFALVPNALLEDAVATAKLPTAVE